MMLPQDLKPFLDELGGYNRPTIHIAGSKGKGSTCMLLAYLLKVKGQKVGHFISPFILDERECMQINGELISESEHKRLQSLMSDKLSPFEKRCLMALRYFQEQNCDFVVLETGWGGRDDATNIVESKVLTILTHIELEHTKTLGNSIEIITKKKLGITRKGVPLLTPPNQVAEVNKVIKEMKLEPIYTAEIELAYHHPESVGLAIAAMEQLGFEVTKDDREALSLFKLQARFELKKVGPHTIILDGAHTYDSVTYVQNCVHRFMRENNFEEVQWAIHFLKDKPESISRLFPHKNTVWITIENPRAGDNPQNFTSKSMEEIFSYLDQTKEPQLLVILGSFKLVAAALNFPKAIDV